MIDPECTSAQDCCTIIDQYRVFLFLFFFLGGMRNCQLTHGRQPKTVAAHKIVLRPQSRTAAAMLSPTVVASSRIGGPRPHCLGVVDRPAAAGRRSSRWHPNHSRCKEYSIAALGDIRAGSD